MDWLGTIPSLVFLIACHGGAADHFATFAQSLSNEMMSIQICASGPALKKFTERGVRVAHPFSLDQISDQEEDVLAEQMAKICSVATVVITDIGHKFDIKIHKALCQYAGNVARVAYYDNPEPYVPGGYSEIASEVVQVAQEIWFANSNLVIQPLSQDFGREIVVDTQKKIGIGYYSLEASKTINSRRATEHQSLRKRLFSDNNLNDQGQKVLVYFGSNNQEYYQKALPAFLELLDKAMDVSDLSNLLILIQQHPGAKLNNLDQTIILNWMHSQSELSKGPTVVVSQQTSDESQIVADLILYYQTSMAPQFVLAGIPTVQVGHETYNDVLVKNGICQSVTTSKDLLKAIEDLTAQFYTNYSERIIECLGVCEHWQENFIQALNNRDPA